MTAFPNAKVVLTVRDPEKWYGSVSTSIGTIRKRLVGFKKIYEFLVGHLRLLQLIAYLQNYPDPVTEQGKNFQHDTFQRFTDNIYSDRNAVINQKSIF